MMAEGYSETELGSFRASSTTYPKVKICLFQAVKNSQRIGY